MTKAHIITSNGVSIVYGDNNYFVSNESFHYATLVKQLESGDYVAAVELAKKPDDEPMSIFGEELGEYFKTVPAPLREVLKNGNMVGQDLTKYIRNLRKNTSHRSLKLLFDFQQKHSMPITSDGYVIAYKAVDENWYSFTGNNSVVVVSGVTDGEGHIRNRIGDVVELDRGSVDDDPDSACSVGLHAGSIEYARRFGEWNSKFRLIIVKINPADVVCVPYDCDQQKIRCSKYTVVGELDSRIGEKIEDQFLDEECNPVPKIEDYKAMITAVRDGECSGMTFGEISEKFSLDIDIVAEQIIKNTNLYLPVSQDKTEWMTI